MKLQGTYYRPPSRRKPLLFLLGFVVLIILVWPRERSTSQAQADLNFGALELPSLPVELVAQPRLRENLTNPGLQVGAALLIDRDSGEILFSKRPETPVPIASTTKLMTALLTRQALELDTVITVTREQTLLIGSDIQLRPDEKLTVKALLSGLLIQSGNDAAAALADAVAGNKDTFVARMNTEAQKLGMANTVYADPAGLDDTGRSTAFDLSIIARIALRDPVLAGIMQTAEMTITSTDGLIRHDLKNSNRLVGEFKYLGATGLKTGYTPDAGHCLVGSAARDGHELIAVVLHTDADTITASAIEARKLLDWGWRNTEWTN